MKKRVDGRAPDELRPVSLTPGFVAYPEGSLLIAMGETRVLCNATLQPGVPRWMSEQGRPGGWVTAEYALLPRSTQRRSSREIRGLRGRTHEIQRLIGRSLRAAVHLELLGERTCIVDCDVLQADGGTRTAAITGGYVALALALQRLQADGQVPPEVFAAPVAAISVGMVGGEALLDLSYTEDVAADSDVNVVMNAGGAFVEVQGTSEGELFTRAELDRMLDFAERGIRSLLQAQQSVLRV